MLARKKMATKKIISVLFERKFILYTYARHFHKNANFHRFRKTYSEIQTLFFLIIFAF